MDTTRTGRYLLVATTVWLERTLIAAMPKRSLTSGTFDDCCVLMEYAFHQLHPDSLAELLVSASTTSVAANQRLRLIMERTVQSAAVTLLGQYGVAAPNPAFTVNVYDDRAMFFERLVGGWFDLTVVPTETALVLATSRNRVLAQGGFVSTNPRQVDHHRAARPDQQHSHYRRQLVQRLAQTDTPTLVDSSTMSELAHRNSD